MKTVKITISQESKGLSLVRNYTGEFAEREDFKAKIIGSSLQSVFNLLKLRQSVTGVNKKIFSLSESLDVTIETDGVKISTIELRKELRMKLKIGNKAKAQRNFAATFKAIIDYAMLEEKVVTLEQVMESIVDEQ